MIGLSVRDSQSAAKPFLNDAMKRPTPNLWLDTLGSGLSILMDEAGYDLETQDSGLQFFSQHVVPYLGPCPVKGLPWRWKSFMTDDFSTLEYSWSWSSSPKIRYSFEPVGANAGTAGDPFNRAGPLECAEELRSTIPGSDWRLFDSFAGSLHDSTRDAGLALENNRSLSSPSSIFLAIEVGKRETMAKAYLIPVRAEQIRKSRLSILSESIEKAPIELPAFKPLDEFIRQRQKTSPLQIIGIAVDCIDPSISKLKIYLRSQETSFTSICSILSLNGRIKTWDDETTRELWGLWTLVLSLPSTHSVHDPLDPGTPQHETSGILYNFDIQTTNHIPSSKIYIPVKHYGKNDRAIAQGLLTFLQQRGRTDHTEEFLRAIESLSEYRLLEDGCGLQTYISCAVKNGRLDLTSYISPEIHHPGRWR